MFTSYADNNCIQVRAPDNVGGCNKGNYDPGEHIGHLKREWAAKLAPILDELEHSNMLDFVSFDCHLDDNDTSHRRKGYSLNIVIMCRDIPGLSKKIVNLIAVYRL